jgi:hypothetical protein
MHLGARLLTCSFVLLCRNGRFSQTPKLFPARYPAGNTGGLDDFTPPRTGVSEAIMNLGAHFPISSFALLLCRNGRSFPNFSCSLSGGNTGGLDDPPRGLTFSFVLLSRKGRLLFRLLNFFPARYLQGIRAGWTTSPPPRTGAAARPSSNSRRGRFSPTPARTFSHRSTGRTWTGKMSTSAAAALCWWTCPGQAPRSWCLPWGRTGWCTLGTGTTWGEWGGPFSRRR